MFKDEIESIKIYSHKNGANYILMVIDNGMVLDSAVVTFYELNDTVEDLKEIYSDTGRVVEFIQ